MSATVALPRTVRTPFAHTLRTLLLGYVVLALWATAVAVVVGIGIAVAVDRAGTLGESVAQYARQGFVWFPFSVALVAMGGHVAAHLAAGLTRRALADAAVVAAVVMSAVYTALLVLAMQLERLVFVRTDRTHALNQDWSLPTRSDQVGLLALDAGLMILAAHVCALLVWVVYRRAGGWWGTLALPLTAGPILGVPALLGLTALAPSLRVLVAVAVPAVLAAVFHRLVLGVELTKVEQ